MAENNKNHGSGNHEKNENHSSQGGNRSNTSNRGFASMDEEKQREIASKGGHAAHEKGTAHEWNSKEAAAAGKKGGQARGGQSRNNE